MSRFIPHSGYTSLKWPEILWITLLVIGLIFSLSTMGSAIMYYIVAFLCGMLFGRLWYKTKKTLQFKYLMMIVAFMVGFVLGNYIKGYGHPELTILIYVVGITISYYFHSRNVVHGIDF